MITGEVVFSQQVCPNCGSSGREVTLYANGTCSACGAPPERKNEMELTRNVFVCSNCGSGSSIFEKVFAGGVCNNCGAPAGKEIGIVATAEKVRVSGKFALVVYASDAEVPGKKIESMLEEHKVTFVNVKDLYLSDLQQDMKQLAIRYFVERAAQVFFVMSDEVDTNNRDYLSLIKECVDSGKIIPIHTSKTNLEGQAVFYTRNYQKIDLRREDLKEYFLKGINLWFKN